MHAFLRPDDMAAWRAFQWANTVITGRLAQDLNEGGLSLAEFDVLIHLYEADHGSLSLQEVAETMVTGGLLSRSGVTRLLDRMERDGLVRRDLNRSDRRRFDVHLTDKGRTVFEQVWPGHQRGIADRFVGPMTSDEIAGLHKTLTKLIEANEQGR